MTASRWIPPAIWAVLILVLSSVPNPSFPVPDAFPGVDKLAHALVYAVLGWLTFGASRASGTRARALVLTILGVAAFGLVDEWHQQFIPGRFVELWDLAADVCGGAVGSLLGAYLKSASYS